MKLSTVLVLAVLVAAAVPCRGDVQFSRTVNSVSHAKGSITFGSDCTAHDQYGDNDCDFHWGDTLNIKAGATFDEDVTGGSLSVDLKVDGILPLKTSCAICGANCTVTIPIVKKTITFAMPPCPLAKANVPFSIAKAVTLPSTSPVPISAKVTGSVTATDQSGNKLIDMSITAALSASAQTRSTHAASNAALVAAALFE